MRSTRSAPRASVPATRATVLVGPRLLVELHTDDPAPFLRLRSPVDPRLDVLLPVGAAPPLAGLSGCLRLGRLHGLCWAFVYGRGPLPSDVRVEFSTERLRFRQSVAAAPERLSETCWCCAVEGVLDVVALVGPDDDELARVPLAAHW